MTRTPLLVPRREQGHPRRHWVMRFAWRRMLWVGIVLTGAMLYGAISGVFPAGYLLAILGVIFVVTAAVNLKQLPRE